MAGNVKSFLRELIEIGLILIALGIVLSILVGGVLPFFGSIIDNLTGLVGKLGSQGVVGLIVLGFILWLFSGRPAGAGR